MISSKLDETALQAAAEACERSATVWQGFAARDAECVIRAYLQALGMLEWPPIGERERLRKAQADAVMPLIGPLLDAWEHATMLDSGHTFSEECSELDSYLRAINSAMENAE